ncbi:sodium:proton antiporter [Massilia agilis]|uniref:Sodium:proton antiporter n=1 Tax=Massilia agilis TaxID=1811226 RepID=A0ABT2DCM4_9BURK|nr:sodium:proton antiporter [Massilia agilis]MCS0808883.1 sodium:proton antiporter [Massilia agilis]
MPMTYWMLFGGLTLIAMMLIGTLLARLPLSGAMIYLALGFVLGPAGVGVLMPDPWRNAAMLELGAEAALLISLFAVGLKLEVPLLDRRWIAPLRLAFVSMAITVGLIAAMGVYGLRLPLGAAVLLGGILAPTDPVLASGVQPESGHAPNPARFNLAGEGALNDGSAFPFVLLGLGLMGWHDLGARAWHWWLVDLLWATVGGTLVGAMVGGLLGTLVVFLRNRHQEALGLSEFLSLGTVAVAYGLAQLCLASGFLAVFTAGLALRRVQEHPSMSQPSPVPPPSTGPVHHHVSAAMKREVQGFNEQIEKLAELVLVILTGAMLGYITIFPALWWFTAVSIFAVRPLSVFVGMAGSALPPHRCVVMGWFGIRGIGSVYYLMFALNHGLSGALAQQFVALTLVAVTASILLHGITAHPVMRWYAHAQAVTPER